ncbi:UBA3-binding But2 family protein [Metarhizium robertsii]|uniref:Ubiquitin 3 binding protein But2 n=2 Tax=Metarhizium robertsii TaxID=568076 RepID=E9EQE5_METRA|nr:Ubiquitin 3 binding protein But2 [Metarhizium robertsii ARSEF 23]EFZ02346.1 Ubiquitin 3 binding protein But2 [Metarhizium robertsii ARSEF 23]EXV05531.1 UBA3-binding But2 family protein [Metarhizium robertsii]
MLSLLLYVGLANAAVVRNSECDFHMNAAGSHGGPLGELNGGQIRFGNIPQTTFHIDGDKIWDRNGHGCWWTPPTRVLQCDTNQPPDSGFTIGCDGRVSYHGQTAFYQCETGDDNQYNIYLGPNKGINCGEVTLTADGCHIACPPPPQPAKSCPANLNGAYEFPHLIVSVDKSNPDKAAGTSFFGEVTSSISSIFNFDIPAADAGKTCTLVFLFPRQDQLTTSSFTFSGDGKIDFSLLNSPATQGTTWNNQPGKKTDYGITTVAPGNSYTIASFPCPAGQAIGFEMSDCGNTNFRYFQDYNPSPIGLYITKC